MRAFRTNGGGGVAYTVAFSEYPYANISFFDRARDRILFHLSLRREKNIAAINTRDGKAWGGEEQAPVTLADAGDRVEIRIDPPRVTVTLNDAVLFDRDTGFPDLARIAFVNFGGGVEAESFAVSGPANEGRRGEGVLNLMPLLVLEGWAFDPAQADQSYEIEIEGMDEPPIPTVYDRADLARRVEAPTDEIGVYAVLPGRVWEAPGAETGLLVQVYSNGIPCGAPLALKPADALARIEAMAETPAGDLPSFAALQAIEHTRYGRFFGRLSAHAQGFVTEAARLYGVSDFLSPREDGTPVDMPPPPTHHIPADIALMDRVRNAFLEATRKDPGRDPAEILASEIAFHLPPPPARKRLFLALTEHFCQEDRFPGLYDLAQQHGDTAFRLTGSPWHDTMVLPYLYVQGAYETILDILGTVTARAAHAGSTVTPAWIVRQIASDRRPRPEPEVAAALLEAWFGLAEAMAPRYWDRALCTEMIGAAAALVAAGRRFPAPLRERATRFALRLYGLSRGFWAELGAYRVPLEGDLAEAATAFAEIEAALDRGGDPSDALRVFDRLGSIEAPRVRRELLGPAEVAPGPGLLRRLYQDAGDVPAAALRALAFPGQGADPDLAPAARRGFLEAYGATGLAHAPFYALQEDMARAVQKILKDLEKGTVPAESDLVEGLFPGLATLSDGRSRFLGLALGVTLLDGVLWAGEAGLAGRILAHLGDRVSDLSDADTTLLRQSSAVSAALWALAARYPAGENRFADAAHALFPRLSETLPPMPRVAPDLAQRWAGASRLFGTLVCVISCKANLGTRVEAMRKGWLSRLEALGIPYLVITGDGDGTITGDVLALDAPDDYEGLPQKTLALVDWVLTRTPFPHLLKIDDDCFLNPEAFFYSQSYAKFDYYGRRIVRRAGSMDRTWHMEKSVSRRGRQELDKSPEPAVYCDGGSGYTLSRRAMQALANVRNRPQNRQILQSSFMEDKLVGDLLATARIRPGDEDFFVSVQRRTHSEAIPVSLWANSFHPSKAAPVKLVHLDSDRPQQAVLAGTETHELRPKKVWPSYQPPKLGLDTNTLELVSDEAKLARLNAADLTVIACVRNEMFMAPHFLAHYRALGVESFLIADNCSDDGTLEYLADQPDVALFSVDTQYGLSTYGVAWQQALLSNFRVGRWSLIADADEFLVYPGWKRESLARHLADPAYDAADAVRIFMLDMYPKGAMAEATFASGDPFAEADHVDREPFLTNWPGRGPYSNAPTWTSALRHRLVPGSFPALFVAQKIALVKYRPWMRLAAGLHYAADTRLSTRELLFAHFKYNAEFRNKALAETRRRQHFNNAEEYQKYLALASEGRDSIYDPALSVPWLDSPFVQQLMGGQG